MVPANAPAVNRAAICLPGDPANVPSDDSFSPKTPNARNANSLYHGNTVNVVAL